MKQKFRNFAKDFQASFGQMPFFLKFLTIVGCFGFFFIVLPLLPFADFEIEGRSVDIEEFWSSGVAIGSILTGIFLLIFVKKTIRKNHWGRLFFIFAWSSACFNPYAIRMGYLLNFGYMINVLIPLGIWVWYLYFKKSVHLYFSTE